MLLSRVLAVPLLLLMLPVVVQSQFLTDDMDNLIPQWLPQCFSGFDAFNPFAVVDCVQDNIAPQCLEEIALSKTFTDVVQCINASLSDDVAALFDGEETQQQDTPDTTTIEGFLSDVIGIDTEGLFNIAGLFVNTTLECLDPYVGCVNETIQTAISSNLEPCLNATLTSFVECGRVNNETCLTSCQESLPTIDTFLLGIQGISPTSIATCPQIQTNIMNPVCDIVDCCEPCVEPLEELMDCLVNEQLGQVPVSGAECELICPEPERRQRHLRDQTSADITDRRQHRRRKLASLMQNGEDCLQFAPGLTGDDTSEFADRSSIFLECSFDTFVAAMEEEEYEEAGTAMEEEEEEDPIISNNDNDGMTGNGNEQEEDANEEQNSDGDENTEDEETQEEESEPTTENTSSVRSLVGSIGYLAMMGTVLCAVLLL